jgi:hypothetical protein
MKWLLTLAFVLSTTSIAVEQNVPSTSDGNQLLPRCQSAIDALGHDSWKSHQESFDTGYCSGLVEGISYASTHSCLPDGATVGQAVRVVVKYLNDHPEDLNLDERELVDVALGLAFPCPTTPPRQNPPTKKK